MKNLFTDDGRATSRPLEVMLGARGGGAKRSPSAPLPAASVSACFSAAGGAAQRKGARLRMVGYFL